MKLSKKFILLILFSLSLYLPSVFALSPKTALQTAPFKQSIPSKNVADQPSLALSATQAVAVTVVNAGLRGAALGLPKDEAETVKDTADELAKEAFEAEVYRQNVKMIVYASEGAGRDEVANSFVGGEVINPDGTTTVHANLDVIEGTNPFAENNGGLSFEEIDDTVAGAMAAAVTGTAVQALGMSDDGYADLFLTHVPPDKVSGWNDLNLNPKYEHLPYILYRLKKVARDNHISINDLEVVIMKRGRAKQRLIALKAIQETFPGLKITEIEDGSVAHALMATLKRNQGKHKVVWTVAAAPESSMNLVLAYAFQSKGAIAGMSVVSTNVNHSEKGTHTADSLRWREKFTEREKKKLRQLRPQDAEEIIAGTKIFTMRSIQGDVDAAFAFITDSGVFAQKGVEMLAPGKGIVRTLRIQSNEKGVYAWIEQAEVDVKLLLNNKLRSYQPLKEVASDLEISL